MSAPWTSRKGQPTAAAQKRQRGPSVYIHPLPLLIDPSPRSPFADFLAPLLRSTNLVNPHCSGTYDPATKSVWVTEEESVKVLWRRGFWGKGSLSRSEPTWLQRARNRKALEIEGGEHHLKLTAEELTAKRRLERRDMKIQKAKEKASAISAVPSPSAAMGCPAPPPSAAPTADDVLDRPAPVHVSPKAPKPPRPEMPPELAAELDKVVQMEHLQLVPEEAYFLLWGLGCLDVVVPASASLHYGDGLGQPEADDPFLKLTPASGWALFTSTQASSLCPTFHTEQLPSHAPSLLGSPPGAVRPDNPFIVSYAVFHHFRSLGWVVRSGIKFCVDFVLYGQKGPVGGHAEFSVCIIPTYEDPRDAADAEASKVKDLTRERRSWKWFTTVNRVCSGVKKTLVFAYVVIPSKERCSEADLRTPACLQMYSVKEVAVRRFIPARMRD